MDEVTTWRAMVLDLLTMIGNRLAAIEVSTREIAADARSTASDASSTLSRTVDIDNRQRRRDGGY
jgi:hypothetical protein